MKLILSITCAATLGALAVWAQEANDVDLQSRQTQSARATSASTRPESIPERSQLDELFKQTSMGQAADAQRLRVEWRQLKNNVANDPDLIAAKHAAEAARTDLEKRDLLRSYYKLYYARIRRFPMSPEMKPYVDGMEAGHVGSTAQSHVRPSPSPSPSASPAASPVATP